MLVYLFYHLREREEKILSLIAQQIKNRNRNVCVKIMEADEGMPQALVEKPDVIMTFPIRVIESVEKLALVKRYINAKIICIETEGYWDFNDEKIVAGRIGSIKFSPKLIDYYYLWGQKSREQYSHELLSQNKILSDDRVRISGYVQYDLSIVGQDPEIQRQREYVKNIVEDYNRALLFVSGFSLVEVTIEQMIGMESFSVDENGKPSQTEIQEMETSIKLTREYVNDYVEHILEFANSHKQTCVFVKLHPQEICSRTFEIMKMYENAFQDIGNIILIKEPMFMASLLPYVDTLIHYGSTTKLEAYVYEKPTVLLQSNEAQKYTSASGRDVLCGSTYTVDIKDHDQVQMLLQSELEFKKDDKIEEILKDYFGYAANGNDHPIEDLVDHILDGEKAIPLEKKDVSKELKGVHAGILRKVAIKNGLSELRKCNLKKGICYIKVGLLAGR